MVCFPGLEGQEYISYQPMVPACSEEGGSAGDSEVSHSTSSIALQLAKEIFFFFSVVYLLHGLCTNLITTWRGFKFVN